MFSLFHDGGIFAMTVITILFIALLLAAWKAPRWVREIGHLALAFAAIMTLIPLHNAGDAVMKAGDISPSLIWGGIIIFVTMSFLFAYSRGFMYANF